MPFPWFTIVDGRFHQSEEEKKELHRLATRSHEEFIADSVATGESPIVAELLWASRTCGRAA